MATPDPWADFFDGSTYYTSPPLTDAMVAAAEKALGYTLPASYLRLLRVKNGGAPKRQCHPTAGTHWSDNHMRVVAIFGIGGRWGIDSPEFGTRRMIEQAGYPEIGVIIGWTPTAGHDAIMLDYSACGPQGEPRVSHIEPNRAIARCWRRTSRRSSPGLWTASRMRNSGSGRWRNISGGRKAPRISRLI